MKITYLLAVFGLLCAVAYSLPIDEDQPLEDEPLRGNMTLCRSHYLVMLSRIAKQG